MKPFFTNYRPTLIEVLPQKLHRFAKLFTTKEQLEVYYYKI